MRYGPNSAAVQEIIDFVNSGRLLRHPELPRDSTLLILRDPNEVESYREPSPEFPDAEYNWHDILTYAGECGSDIQSRARTVRLQFPDIVRSEIKALMDETIYEAIKNQLENHYKEDFIECTWECISWIIKYTCELDRLTPLFERMLALLRRGGLPCGWEGDYPQGRLVVYFNED